MFCWNGLLFMVCGPQVRCIRPHEMKGPMLFFLDTMSDFFLGYEYILSWCVTKSNKVMSGSGSFRYNLFPVPKGKHLSPHLPSQTENTLWHHFLGGEFSPRGAQGQGPQLSLGRQESSPGKRIFQNEEAAKQGSVERRPGLFRTAVLRVWSVKPLTSLRCHEIPEVKATFILENPFSRAGLLPPQT